MYGLRDYTDNTLKTKRCKVYVVMLTQETNNKCVSAESLLGFVGISCPGIKKTLLKIDTDMLPHASVISLGSPACLKGL